MPSFPNTSGVQRASMDLKIARLRVRLDSALLLWAMSLVILAGFPPGSLGPTTALEAESRLPKSVSQQSRIRRIENGLLPAVLIKGERQRGMGITDRMRHYKVPGVSIAFFDHGMIAWTRTY